MSVLLWNFVNFLTFLQRLSVPIFASFYKVDRDLQKYRHLKMSFAYDVINVFLLPTINDMVMKIL